MPNQDAFYFLLSQGKLVGIDAMRKYGVRDAVSRVESVDVTSTGDGDSLKSRLPARDLTIVLSTRRQMAAGVDFHSGSSLKGP
jgi:hypothetical protein